MRRVSNRFINLFYCPLIVISLIGSISYLLNQIYLLSTKEIIVLDVVMIIIGAGYLLMWGGEESKENYFNNNRQNGSNL
jgi:hypothetical protein